MCGYKAEEIPIDGCDEEWTFVTAHGMAWRFWRAFDKTTDETGCRIMIFRHG